MKPLLAAGITLLLMLGFLPLVGAQPSGKSAELTHQDPKGDALPLGPNFGGMPVGLLPTPLSDGVDLVSFRLYGEDMEGLYLEIGVNQLKPNPPQMSELGVYSFFDITFRLDGSQANYRLYFSIPGSYARNPVGQVPMPAQLCINDGSRGGCNQQRVFAVLDWEKSTMTAYLTKQSLMGNDPVGNRGGPANPPRLELGSRLTEFRVRSSGGPIFGLFSDTMPNTGTIGPYTMQAKAANDRLRLKLHKEGIETSNQGRPDQFSFNPTSIQDFPQASVSPGSTALVQIGVENWNAGKRLINLSAELVDPKAAAKWETRIVKTITIPGEDRRIVNLIVNLTGNVEHRESALLRITARSLGFADEMGVMKVRLVAAVPPSPAAKNLYFHSSASQGSTLCIGCFAPSWLNTLEADPSATADDGIPFGSQSNTPAGAQFSRIFTLDAPLNKDVVMNPRDPITATLKFQSDLPFTGTAKLELSAGDLYIGSGEAPWSGQGAVQISFQPSLESERIPTGATITARVILSSNQPQPATFIGIPSTRPEFVGKGSVITLPIIPDPKPPVRTAIPAGPAFLTLEVEGEPEQFVNPGKVKVFRITIVNEGVQEDVIDIEATKDPENWYVALNPGDTFRLKPGESAEFGVLVKPPSGAKEGEQAHILLNATSRADSAALAQASLTAIVTTGVEIEDEADNFTADEDTVSHVEETERKKSPGVGLVGVVAVAGVIVLARRRRWV